MKDDYLSGAAVEVDLSDLSRSDITSLSLDEMDTISLDSIANLAPPSYNYGSYTYPNNGVSSISIAGSGAGFGLSGSSTSIYTTTASPSISISPNTYTNASWATAPLTVNGNGNPGITVKGDADIEGDLKVKGVSLTEMLSKMQDQLAIYQPAPELEEKWEQLRDLARQYKELVADIKEKEKIWDILQK